MAPDSLIALPDEGARGRGGVLLQAGIGRLFLGVLTGTGVVDTFFPVPPPRLPVQQRVEYAAMVEEANLRDGSRARLFEYDWRLTSRVRRALAVPYSTFLFETFHETSQSGLRGEGDWLFLKFRAEPPRLADEEIANLGASVVAALERRVEAFGWSMTTVPVPRKSVLHEDRLPRGIDPRPRIDERLQEALRERGVHSTDLLRLFRAQEEGAIYYPCDSHWTPATQLLAAEEMARVAEVLAPEEERITRVRPVDETTPLTRLDILRYIDVELEGDRLAALREQGVRNYSIEMGEGPPRKFAPEVAVSRESGVVAISGTSFSDDGRFPRYLAHFCQKPVFNGAVAAANFAGPLRILLRRRESLPELETVFFEFPVHQIFFAPDGDGVALLPRAVGNLFAENPPSRRTRLVDRSRFAVGEPFREGRTVELERGETVPLIELREGLLHHRGEGAVAIVLTGEARGGELELELLVGGTSMRALWPEGAETVVLPLVCAHPGAHGIEVRARARSGDATLRLDSVEACVELAEEDAVDLPFDAPAPDAASWVAEARHGEPGAPAEHDVLVLQLEDGPARATISELRIRPADRPETIRIVPLAEIDGPAVVVIHLGGLAGERLECVELRGSGSPPGLESVAATLRLFSR